MKTVSSIFMDGKSGVSCPALGCGKALSQLELRACIGDQRATQLDRRALELAVSIDPTLHICPTPDCQMVREHDLAAVPA
jgi:hypothetical protein